jgi:hypothetical protein
MLTKTKAAVVAAILLGSASGAVADNSQFDVNIYRPTPQGNALDAYAQEPAQLHNRVAPRGVKPFHIQEKLWFNRASQQS